MISAFRLVSLIGVSALVMCLGPARAGYLPSIPGVPSVQQATKAVVSKELVKQMGAEFALEQPLRLSADANYPTTETLPGGRFRPVSENIVKQLYSHAHDGRVVFPPGDYAISVFAYCMLAHEHVPNRNKFRLTPIQGRWADIASALFARTSYGYNPHDVQILTWSLLGGLKYSELSPASQHLVDAVLPDFKSRMQMSFYEKLQRYWTQISANVPGAPSFDAALGQMGDVGKSIIALRDIRNELISNAATYDNIERDFATIGVARIPSDVAPTPWSIVQPGVYARMLIKAGYLSPGVLQIRVTRQAIAGQGIRVASVGSTAYAHVLKSEVAQGGVGVPTTGWAGFPGAAVQALGWNPKPGDAPGPGVPGGGNPGGGPSGGQAPGGNGPPSGQNPGNSGQPPGGENPGGNGPGGGGGNNGGGNNGGNGPNNDNDDGDSSSPCDPPDNMFGVDNGTLNSDSAAGMNLGRGKGHGIVCLLLRPFISLVPLGWPTRPGGQVDDGSVSFSLFGHPQPGHVVVLAHYTYATGSTPTQLFAKKHITAVIDYAGVTAFCPDLVQTLAGNGVQQVPGWLSGAELENRLCITGMRGQTIQVTAWAVDGDSAGVQANTHQVDPSNFLYADFWGHM